jgi:hypothetical protein
MAMISTHRRYTRRKAAPPCSPARYGNLHILPKPIALPAATRIALSLPPKEALVSLLIVLKLILRLRKDNTKVGRL